MGDGQTFEMAILVGDVGMSIINEVGDVGMSIISEWAGVYHGTGRWKCHIELCNQCLAFYI
jgi:hypothetical protein